MCTLTWFKHDSGYQLFFTRDELKSRQTALPPCRHQKQNTWIISPTDGDAGGTWISLNSYGLSLCLLNYYEKEQTFESTKNISRGQIVDQLSSCKNTVDVEQQLSNIDLGGFKPFKLFAIAKNQTTNLYVWDGEQLKINQAPPFIASSSFDTTQVISHRYAEFLSKAAASIASHVSLHQSHQPNASAYSVCMHRADAQSVSFSRLSVGSTVGRFYYAGGPPCETRFEPPQSLQLQG